MGKTSLQPGIVNAVIFQDRVKPQDYRQLTKVPDKINCRKGMYNNIVYIFQGIGDIKGPITSFLIHRNELSQGAKVTYVCIFYNIQPHKKETHRVRITVEGNELTFSGPLSTPTSDITTSKIHWNSVLLTPGSK